MIETVSERSEGTTGTARPAAAEPSVSEAES